VTKSEILDAALDLLDEGGPQVFSRPLPAGRAAELLTAAALGNLASA
jgi:hypothetical protein